MSQINRLPSGARIDSSVAVKFTFNGKQLQGVAGDTLASALLANGVNVVGRSFKYSRPRGIAIAISSAMASARAASLSSPMVVCAARHTTGTRFVACVAAAAASPRMTRAGGKARRRPNFVVGVDVRA